MMAELESHAWSVAEIDSIPVWDLANIGVGVRNVVLRDADGRFVGRPDTYSPAGLAWEVDSVRHHSEATDFARTLERNVRYLAVGITVLQTLPRRLRSEPEAVAAELRAAYRRACANPPPTIHIDTR
ncbi:hypothetical protein D5S17_24420 [Pseudonocardiaceae bacterium YIM PH 21723]|nr:hypothetical protein D5S17_24420 [Pseudonocardiaceae bacterium YIM PH 21723]